MFQQSGHGTENRLFGNNCFVIHQAFFFAHSFSFLIVDGSISNIRNMS